MAHKPKEQHVVLSIDAESDDIKTLDVRRFMVHEELSGLFSIRLLVMSPNPDLDLSQIIGKSCAFQIRTGLLWTSTELRLWSGVCEHAEQVEVSATGEEDRSTYQLHIVPALWLLTQRRETRIFQHMTLPDIILKVLKEWGIEPINEIKGKYAKREYVVQYGETDYDFLCRLMEWAGITYYFKFPTESRDVRPPDKDADKKSSDPKKKDEPPPPRVHPGSGMIIWAEPTEEQKKEKAEQPTAGKPLKLALSDQIDKNEPRINERIHYENVPTQAAQLEYITRVEIRHDVRPGKFTIRDDSFRKRIDYQLFGKKELDQAEKGEDASVPEDFYEQYHYWPGTFTAEGRPDGGSPTADSPYAYHPNEKDEGAPLAERGLAAVRTGRRVVKFVTNCIDLAPGVIFKVADYPREDVRDHQLLITRFSIEGVVNDEWTYSGEAVYAAVPYRPAMKTPKPRIRGVQSAIVVGPKGQEIWVDEFGRIKVQFHWDRDGNYDDKSACWVRVSHEWAGSGFGMMLLPRVGQEVLIGFLEGDPDLPVVVGRVYNNITRVPYPLPLNKTRSTWKSDSSGKDAKKDEQGFNELMFEDNKDKELVYLQAQTDLKKLVKEHETDRVGQNHMTVIGKTRAAVVSKLEATMVGKRYLLRTIKKPSKDDLAILPQKAPKITPQKTAVEVQENRVIYTTGQATVAFVGPNIRFQATGDITVIANSGDCIIEGDHVYLNTKTPKQAPKPDPFELPPHGLHSGKAADARQEIDREGDRDQIKTGLKDITPPGWEPPETIICELVGSKVTCMHGRQPCVDPKDPLFTVLQVVPSLKVDKFEAPKDENGDPKKTFWKDQVKEGGDIISVESKLIGGCGKHTAWTLDTPKGRENKIGEKHSLDSGGWLVAPWLASIKFSSKDWLKGKEWAGAVKVAKNPKQFKEALEKKIADDEKKAEEDKAKKARGEEVEEEAEPWIEGEVEGLSWAAIASPKRYAVEANACRVPGPEGIRLHRYTIEVFPCDKLKASAKVDLTNESLGKIGLGWVSKISDAVGSLKGSALGFDFKAEFSAEIALEAEAEWKEWKDHRAYYHYDVTFKLEAGVKFEMTIEIQDKIPYVGLAVKAINELVGAVKSVWDWFTGGSSIEGEFALLKLPVSLSAELKGSGEVKMERKSPDTLKPVMSGKIGATFTIEASASAFLVHKGVVSASAKGTFEAKVEGVPDQGTINTPPGIAFSGSLTPFKVEVEYTFFKYKGQGEREFFKSLENVKFEKKRLEPLGWLHKSSRAY